MSDTYDTFVTQLNLQNKPFTERRGIAQYVEYEDDTLIHTIVFSDTGVELGHLPDITKAERQAQLDAYKQSLTIKPPEGIELNYHQVHPTTRQRVIEIRQYIKASKREDFAHNNDIYSFATPDKAQQFLMDFMTWRK